MINQRIQSFVIRREKAILLLILAAGLFLRFFNVPGWLLANCDEVASLNQMTIPFLSGANTSTNYLLTTVVLKIAGPFLPFPSIRFLCGLASMAGLFLLYRALRKSAGAAIALAALLLLSFSWNMVYYARLFEAGSFTPAVACLFLCCVLLWLHDERKVGWLYAAGFLLGFHFNTHAMPTLYAIAAFSAYMLLAFHRKRLGWRDVFGTISMILWGSLPYLYSLFSFPHFERDIQVSYGTAHSAAVLQLAINLKNPVFSLVTLAEYVTCYPVSADSYARMAFTIVAIIIPIIAYLSGRRSPEAGFCFFFVYVTLTLICISPIPLYNEGHLHYFWVHYVVLLSLLLRDSKGWMKGAIGLVCMAIITMNILWMPQVFQNQVKTVEKIIENHLREGDIIYMSDGAYLKLRMLGLFKKLEGHEQVRFECMGPEEMKPFKSMNLRGRAMVFTTSEGAWPPPELVVNHRYTTLATLEGLIEAHLKHGMQIYLVEPAGRKER